MIFYLDYQETLNTKSFNQKKTSANFKFLKQAIEANGGIFSVTIIPPKSSYLKGDPKRDKLKKILIENNIPFLDLNQVLKDSGISKNAIWWSDDTHFSPNGAKLTAKSLKGFL